MWTKVASYDHTLNINEQPKLLSKSKGVKKIKNSIQIRKKKKKKRETVYREDGVNN